MWQYIVYMKSTWQGIPVYWSHAVAAGMKSQTQPDTDDVNPFMTVGAKNLPLVISL